MILIKPLYEGDCLESSKWKPPTRLEGNPRRVTFLITQRSPSVWDADSGHKRFGQNVSVLRNVYKPLSNSVLVYPALPRFTDVTPGVTHTGLPLRRWNELLT